MFVCDLVAGLFGRIEQVGSLSDAFSACFGIEAVGCGVAGDGFGLPEPAVRRWRHRALTRRRKVVDQRVDGSPWLARYIDTVSHGFGYSPTSGRRFVERDLTVVASVIGGGAASATENNIKQLLTVATGTT
jgi:hypothetical protein